MVGAPTLLSCPLSSLVLQNANLAYKISDLAFLKFPLPGSLP